MTDLKQQRWAAQRELLILTNACQSAALALEALYPPPANWRLPVGEWRESSRAFNIRIAAARLHATIQAFPKEVKE